MGKALADEMAQHLRLDRAAGLNREQRQLLGQLVVINRQPRLARDVDHLRRRCIVDLARDVEKRHLRRAIRLSQISLRRR